MSILVGTGFDDPTFSVRTRRCSRTRPMAVTSRVVLSTLGSLLAVAACDTFTEPGDEYGPAIQTDSLEYHLIPHWIGLGVHIPYTFENRTGRRVFLVNCNGTFSILLQREENGEWKKAWSPVLPMCLSPPIVIEPNETFASTLGVWGAPPDSTHYGPNFDVADPSGIYRIVWGTGLWSFQSDTLPFGPQIPLKWRVSNRFTLRR